MMKIRIVLPRSFFVGEEEYTLEHERAKMLCFQPCALFCLQVLELNLDNCRTTGQVEGLTESFVNLDYLSLNNAGLTSLKNFPKLPNLRRVSTVSIM